MLEEKKNKIKEIFSSNFANTNNKKKIENLVVFIVILIITIIIINAIWNDNKNELDNTQTQADSILAETKNENYTGGETEIELELEEKLENILKKMEGVGDVKVLLTYSKSSTTVAMYNEDSKKSDTEETDSRRRK